MKGAKRRGQVRTQVIRLGAMRYRAVQLGRLVAIGRRRSLLCGKVVLTSREI